MPHPYFPLHWESTGNKWWYASPIDFAAANGQYEVVRELLHIDINLLIKLTSLRRIRRLETLWDDDCQFTEAAKCRSFVARKLLLECETKNKNSLIRAGYGGWLLYTAATAGDMEFINELLERDPLLVFGEGEYGVTDILYAAARSKSSQVFKAIFEALTSPKGLVGPVGAHEGLGSGNDDLSLFKSEMVNRALFAAARGGNLEMLKELLGQSSDVLAYRDNEGATILHGASGRGQVEVVNCLITSHNIIFSRDNRGNTALHVAAFWGHLAVFEALILASLPLSSVKNNDGDTFLHKAVAGFQARGFQTLGCQMELIRRLISGDLFNVQEIVNLQNNIGRTALHLAVIDIENANLIELLLTIPSININIQDNDGLTPLFLLSGYLRSPSSDMISNPIHSRSRSAILQSEMQYGTGNAPGTSFRIPDSEIFLYAGIEAFQSSCKTSSSELPCFEPFEENKHHSNKKEPSNSVVSASKRLRVLLTLPHRREKNTCIDSKQTFSKGASSLLNNKRVTALRTWTPNPVLSKKFGASVGASSHPQTPASPFSCSQFSSPRSERHKGDRITGSSFLRSGLKSAKSLNKYFCFRAEGMAKESSSSNQFDSRCVPPLPRGMNGLTC
ncbi:hypothetical protein HPP92_024351 [Vanilla planifolia]|uniref:Uncharacterized protein n=1 Tax=Vanilla planifolia TaxID=51239 RepID=A0A835UCV5_VANPL|nr:hypothetical protein HPP92_024351 [Vanilla planifolia]